MSSMQVGIVLIRNSQRTVRVSAQRLQKQVHAALTAAKVRDFDVCVSLSGDARLRTLNRVYRNIDKPTDVLSFPFQQVRAGQRPNVIEGVKDLGQIFVSVPYVQRAAREQKQPVHARLAAVVTHGICHLLGYDHKRNSDWRKMLAKERVLLKAMHDATT